jgi:hypothetical protein
MCCEVEDASWFAQAGLSSYLCRLCTMRIHLSMLGVVFTPPQCCNSNLLAFSKSPFDNLLGGSG